jgi:tRNA pseudouridine38-40 synthase
MLLIAYEGTGFCGWQRQEPPDALAKDQPPAPGAMPYKHTTPMIESRRDGRVALRTVQGVVEKAVSDVVRHEVEVMGASRTDSGVHARGQVAAFSCLPLDENPTGREAPALLSPDKPLQPGAGWPASRGVDRLAMAINSRLPADVLIVRAQRVRPDFDPISDVISKAYSYTFHLSRSRPLFDRATVTHIWRDSPIDLQAMQTAAGVLVGEHDFASFAATGHGRLSTVRTVHRCTVTRVPIGEADDADASRVRIDIAGSGFLWNMVRIIAGTLLQVGLKQRTPEDVREILRSKDRTKAGPTAGPEGLCLESITYRDGALDEPA